MMIDHPTRDNLRRGTLADRQRRLGWAASDTAQRAVDLMAAVHAQNPDTVVMALERLERRVEAVRALLADIETAPSDAEVEAYRVELRTAPPIGAILEAGERRSGADRRQREDGYWVKVVGERRRAWPFSARRHADREVAA